ncbi:MAG: class D sortase [Clostridia bacterium]|nr:class D sortase [Clostridia bacterium]
MKRKLIVIIAIILLILLGTCIYYFSNYDSKLVDINDIKTDPGYVHVTYNNVDDIVNEDILGILTIEKIGLKANVKEGSDNKTLKNYIGHIEETSLYDGNIGLAAHNRGNKYSYFARINELQKGDIITYQTKFYTRNYKVDNIQTIFETEWKLLENTEDNKITLITCIANKKNQRLCVQATEILEQDL